MSSRDRTTTLTSKIEHAEIDEHLDKIAKNLIVGDLFYTISIATNNRTRPPFFSGSISWTWMKSFLNIQWTIISSDAGLASTRWQAISRTNDDQAPGNLTLWRGVPVTPIQKSFGSSERDWKTEENNYRFLVNYARSFSGPISSKLACSG